MASIGCISAAVSVLVLASGAATADEGAFGWFSGDWYLTLGATGMVRPSFEGSKSYMLSALPIVSLGKAGPELRYSSRNDNISLALIDDGVVRAGVAGKINFGRDADDELQGLADIPWGGELGGFFEFYPTDWMRARAELRHGIRSHNGFVADIAVDAFHDVAPNVRVSGGPRVSFASADYFETYYGVNAQQSAASGLGQYDPGSGINSVGVGGAIGWKATDNVVASLFTEYSRLMGPAGDSTIVKERGSRNQVTVGVSTSYRFDFNL
ncbi:MipA/OmpV family protein [Aminobacter sp. AP02]|uniref:MipA/OmpV family protein n=1 Tax=Aminobacter sp. AP02 TaxID=2135737 RepID=UPI000D6C861A|nr:MipA/OmpV family protein [Aminobacter sp. AP02]PWK75512.1 outer membrane scaffolding protein for murein synthesis (MipA/OmpV family) [Aminobacter sp. AP02]